MDTLVGIFVSFLGEMQVEHGGFEPGVSEIARDEPEVAASFEEMRGERVPARIVTLLICRQYFRSVTPTIPSLARRLSLSEGYAVRPRTASSLNSPMV
jgi:hypothetical protein